MKEMHNSQLIEFAISKSNLPHWQSINKEIYFEILSVEVINDNAYRIKAMIDMLYIGVLFNDIFHEGVQSGITSLSKQIKTINQ